MPRSGRAILVLMVLSYGKIEKLREDLLSSKAFPCHILAPFHINTFISFGSEKQVRAGANAPIAIQHI
jgi:hypothetical protein